MDDQPLRVCSSLCLFYLPQCRVLHANNREAIDPWFPLYSILPDRAPCLRSYLSPLFFFFFVFFLSWHVLLLFSWPGPGGVPSHTRLSAPVSLHLDGPCQLCSAGDTLSRPSAATHDDPRPTHARTPSTAHTLLVLPLTYCLLPTQGCSCLSPASGHRHFHRQF